MTKDELFDLTKSAITRTRKTVELTTQLLDDDGDRATVLMSIAADMIMGSAYCLWQSDEDMTEEKALGLVLKDILGGIGAEEVKAAIEATAPRKKEQQKCGD